jgi:hypothetical protein
MTAGYGSSEDMSIYVKVHSTYIAWVAAARRAAVQKRPREETDDVNFR